MNAIRCLVHEILLEDSLGGKGKYRIISKIVLAKHIFTDGNSIMEWGYSP